MAEHVPLSKVRALVPLVNEPKRRSVIRNLLKHMTLLLKAFFFCQPLKWPMFRYGARRFDGTLRHFELRVVSDYRKAMNCSLLHSSYILMILGLVC